MRALLRVEAQCWCCEHPVTGFSELESLVWESTPYRLAVGAWEHLEELGYRDTSASVAYQRLLRLQAQQKEELF